MKAILMSIRPKWCEMIFSGEKTIEVRETAPKLETPFKVYVYCTSIKNMNLSDYVEMHAKIGGKIDDWSGKVIGEFVCDEIYEFITWGTGVACIDSNLTQVPQERVIKETCLVEQQIMDYLERGIGNYEGVGLHITAPKLYDKSKELSEFRTPETRFYEIKRINGYLVFGDGYRGGKVIIRPPQSWCYVEEVEK